MKQGGASSRRRGLELGWSLPSRGPLARVDVLTRLGPDRRRARLLRRHDLGPRRPADAAPRSPTPTTRPARSRAARDQAYLEPIALAALAPRRHSPRARRDQRAGGAVPQPGGHGQAARHPRRAVRRPPGGGRRGRLVARGVRGAGRPAVRRAGRRHRRVHPAHEGALDGGRAALRRQVLSGREHHDAAAPRAQKPHPPIWVGGHTEPALRRTARLGDVWHPIGLRGPAGLAPGRAGREGRPDPEPRQPGGPRSRRPSVSPSGVPSTSGRPGARRRTEAPSTPGGTARQGGGRHPRLPGGRGGHDHLRLSRGPTRRPWSRQCDASPARCDRVSSVASATRAR